MPVVREMPVRLKMNEVLRGEGFGGHFKIRPEINKLIDELIASVESNYLIEPSMAYEVYHIYDKQFHSESNILAHARMLSSVLAEAQELAYVLCTIGPKLENQVSRYNEMGECLRGVLLDGIGNAAVDSLSQLSCRLIAKEVASHGYQISSPISPGMTVFPITRQQEFLEMVPAQEIGVSFTSLGMLVPRKSASMVIGMGPQVPKWSRAESCARCNLNRTCNYKITAPNCK
jgi:hypothetical protein